MGHLVHSELAKTHCHSPRDKEFLNRNRCEQGERC